MYRVRLENNRSKLQHITYLNTNDDLGKFLLNLSNDYEIRNIAVIEYSELKDSKEFLGKNSNMELGKKEVS